MFLQPAGFEETSPRTGVRLVVVLHVGLAAMADQGDVTAYDQAFSQADHSPNFKRRLVDYKFRPMLNCFDYACRELEQVKERDS